MAKSQTSLRQWALMRALVSGRFIVGYNPHDVVLKFVYRASTLTVGDIVGLNPPVDELSALQIDCVVVSSVDEFAGLL